MKLSSWARLDSPGRLCPHKHFGRPTRYCVLPRHSLKSHPLFTIDVCPWTYPRSSQRCANATSTRGCFMTIIIAIGLPAGLMVTRRWFYLIPAQGEPVKLVHKIEAGHLDSLPGSKRQYSGWQELFDNLKAMLAAYRDVAMQYSPNNIVFTVSLVDGGTIELLRGLGKNILSSADLVARFEATWNEEQIKTHFAARDAVDSITAGAFQEIGRRVRNGGTTEHEIQQWFMEAFRRENLVTDDLPIVAVNANSANPHYEPHAGGSAPIRQGDFVLVDVWA